MTRYISFQRGPNFCWSMVMIYIMTMMMMMMITFSHTTQAFMPSSPSRVVSTRKLSRSGTTTTTTIGNLASVKTTTTTTKLAIHHDGMNLADVAVIANQNDNNDLSSTFWVSGEAGKIDWSNPVEAVVGGITLLYFAFSIWAGIKYIVKDGWRPKL